MLTSLYLHMKSRRVCIKTRSTPASLPLKGLVTKHTTVKWTIQLIHTKTTCRKRNCLQAILKAISLRTISESTEIVPNSEFPQSFIFIKTVIVTCSTLQLLCLDEPKMVSPGRISHLVCLNCKQVDFFPKRVLVHSLRSSFVDSLSFVK